MQKTIQKLVIRIIRDETFGHDTYKYNNRPTKQVSSKKAKCTMWLHIYRKQWKTGSYTWDFL